MEVRHVDLDVGIRSLQEERDGCFRLVVAGRDGKPVDDHPPVVAVLDRLPVLLSRVEILSVLAGQIELSLHARVPSVFSIFIVVNRSTPGSVRSTGSWGWMTF